MSIQEKISNIMDRFKRKKQTDDEFDFETAQTPPDEEKDNGSVDYVEDVPETRTIRKKRILLAMGAVAVFITAAVVSKTFFDEKKQAPERPLSTANAAYNPAQGLPDNYADIAKYQQQANKDAKRKELDQVRANSQSPANTKPKAQKVQTVDTRNVPERVQTVRTVSAPVSRVPSASSSNADRAAREAEKEREAIINSALAFSASAIASGEDIPASAAYTTTNNSTYYPSDYEEAQDYTLNAGTVIPATLLTGITSDVPGGDVVAQIRQDVYDSLTGTHLLIPQGSRLIGTSGAAKSRGNKRMEVIFSRIILPNGMSLMLPEQRAIDGTGYPGLEDQYTEHKGAAYGSAFMAALLGAAAQSATGDTSGDDERSPGQEAVSGAVAQILRTGEKFVDRELEKQPTIEISPGFQFSVFINQDLLIGEYHDY